LLRGFLNKERPDKKKAGHEARRSRGSTKVKTLQRERPTRQRREEESAATLKSAKVHIGCTPLDCNASYLMKGLRAGPDVDFTKAT
jgi:hypothetical protein